MDDLYSLQYNKDTIVDTNHFPVLTTILNNNPLSEIALGQHGFPHS